jgi:uncharacterized protein
VTAARTRPKKPLAVIRLGDIGLDARDYASQGNAVLGIRDSGKSYTSTYLAERLLDAGIPFVAFDPIGLWRFLRVGTGDFPGYPVVVAGGQHGDLPLTPDAAPEIVRAAMREGVSVVLDLYSMELTKADWKRIVERSVRVLLYENKAHGLRHIFIEEAAEFCPQRIGPDQGAVYAEIEKLARMGGNALLGYTLINQRAEEVNKAVLELCDGLFLHRQKGRNSLTALSKWLDIAGAAGTRDVIEALPTLPQGDCFLWAAGSATPVRVHVPEKRTYHPDRRAMRDDVLPKDHEPVDVGAWVEQMSRNLAAQLEAAAENDPARLKKRIAELERQTRSTPAPDPDTLHRAAESGRDQGRQEMRERFGRMLDELRAALDRGTAGDKPAASNPPPPAPPRPRHHAPDERISGPQQRIVEALAWLRMIGIGQGDRVRVAMLAGQSPRSSGYEKNVSTLKSKGLIDYPSPGYLALTPEGAKWGVDLPGFPLTTEHLHASIRDHVSGPQWRILAALIDAYPHALTRDDLARRAHQSVLSSGFEKNVSTLRSLGFIDYPSRGYVVGLPVLFIEARDEVRA